MLELRKKTAAKNERATQAEAHKRYLIINGQYRHSKRKGAGWGIVSIFQGLSQSTRSKTMTKKEAILIANILQAISIETEPNKITFNHKKINDTVSYLITLERITRRAYQKAKMTMSDNEIQSIKRQFLKGKM